MSGGADQVWGASAISVAYGSTLALDRVSVAVTPGQVAAVVGGDGAGKTTLLRCLAGALRPDSGQVRSPGARCIGYLPASSGTYLDLTVAENLAFRAAAYGMPAHAAAERAAELIERAGLSAAQDRLAGQLSGGMRQKLGVIAALLHRPELLVLDEPSTGVDPVSRSGLWWLIASAAADGAAVILATTYIDDAQRAAAVLVLDDGQPLAAGSPEEIVASVAGRVFASAEQPPGSAGRLTWRRGASWRTWWPPGGQPASERGGQPASERGTEPASEPGNNPGSEPDDDPVAPDLQDAFTIAALARELRLSVHSGHAGDVRDRDAEPGRQPARPREQARPREPARSHQPGRPQREAAGPLAECIGATCRFGDVTAVRQVSMSVRAGEIVGLLGANGAGKTTLIRMLLGLIPPSAGQVLLLGGPPGRPTRRRIGYVPQGLGLYDDLTAAENMKFAAAVFGSEPAALPSDVSSLGGVLVGRLPLGLQRRTAFAQALGHQPDLLILDEPTSGVDPLGRARLWQTIAAAARAGVGVLVSTHYMEEAGECDRLVIMADGAVVAEGTADRIIGAAHVTVVETANWAAAFSRLEQSGLAVSLAGRTLRVPGASPADVRQALRDDQPPGADAAGQGLAGQGPASQGLASARIYQAPATLEERFFELVLQGNQGRVPA